MSREILDLIHQAHNKLLEDKRNAEETVRNTRRFYRSNTARKDNGLPELSEKAYWQRYHGIDVIDRRLDELSAQAAHSLRPPVAPYKIPEHRDDIPLTTR